MASPVASKTLRGRPTNIKPPFPEKLSPGRVVFLRRETKFLITGGLAGVLNGLLGTGGGLALVPLLIRWGKLDDKTAMSTSVLVIAVLSLLSAGVYVWKGGMNWTLAWPFLVGGLIGGVAAGLLFKKIRGDFLRRLFGALLLAGGVRMLF